MKKTLKSLSLVSGLFLILFIFSLNALLAQGSGKVPHFTPNDGSPERIDCGNSSSLDITGTGLTIEAWVYDEGVYYYNGNEMKYRGIVTKRTYVDGSLGEIQYMLQSDADNWSFQIGTSTAEYNVTTPHILNNWRHLAATFDGTKLKIFVDGVLKNTTTLTASKSIVSTTYPVIIGARHTSSNGYSDDFKGYIDEVKIWDTALDVETIRAWMCKSVTSSHPQWSHLQGYWRLDEGSNATVVYDETANDNDGSICGTCSWENSGASIGDESTYDYSTPVSVTLSHSDGDFAKVSDITGSPDGVQIYRVDAAPNVTTPPGNMVSLFTNRYWGVKVVGGTSPTYTFTYYYNGNPNVGSYENYQDLAKRSGNNAAAWTESNATLNTTAKTLTLTGQTGTEYIDGREDNPTPVELVGFTATVIDKNRVRLNWRTATEVNNYGFEIERIGEQTSWIKIGFVEGSGTSNSPKEYSFTDDVLKSGKYSYRLKQIDINGNYKYSGVVEVNINAPEKFELKQNYPNPFNPTTTIEYSIPNVRAKNLSPQQNVQLIIYDVLGREITTLVNKRQSPGNYSVKFNASNLPSGVYFYRIRVANFIAIRKMIVIK